MRWSKLLGWKGKGREKGKGTGLGLGSKREDVREGKRKGNMLDPKFNQYEC